MLSSGILYLVQFDSQQLIESNPEQITERATDGEAKYDQQTFRVAIVIVYVDVAIVLLCQFLLGLLNRTMDARNDLLVGNRYVRMAPRLIAIIALAVLWIPEYTNPTEPLGVVLIIVYIVTTWEFIVSMDRDCKFFEPKDAYGLTPITTTRSEP